MRIIDKNYFEKSDGDVRALIANIDAYELIRIILNNPDIRAKVDTEDYTVMANYEILEDAFEYNVRVYLRQRSKINRNIKETVLSDENHRFFYFNNGITITCDSFSYMKSLRAPIVDLRNIQIVNGSQTLHALYEAFKEQPDGLASIDLLCRIYETSNIQLSTRIAEYTNSQNPVNTRDIRSIDFMQQKLEVELRQKGYYYERKKNQYIHQPKHLRIDAEKTGQVLVALYRGLMIDPKSKKKDIFGEHYEEIFDDDITADKVILANRIFEYVEKEKERRKYEILGSRDFTQYLEKYEQDYFIIYGTYHLIYILGELAKINQIALAGSNFDEIVALYPQAFELLQRVVLGGKLQQGSSYTDRLFFQSPRTRLAIDSMLSPLT